MKSSLATLVVLAAFCAAPFQAQARPHHHTAKSASVKPAVGKISGNKASAAKRAVNPAEAEKAMAPLREAATGCFAETVMANPKATGHARAGRWYEAAGVIGFLCRPEVAAMIQTHDRLFGARTGERYFKGAYAKHLDQQLATRLKPMLERTAVASAEPLPERDAGEDAAGN